MKKKLIPLPALVFLIPLLMQYLTGKDAQIPMSLILMAALFTVGMLLGPDLDKAPVTTRKPQLGPDGARRERREESNPSTVAWWFWSKRFYEEPAFRDRQIAALLGVILGAMCFLLLFGDETVILWRLLSVIAGCVIGLLILFIRFLIRRRGRNAVKAPSGAARAAEDFAAVVDDGGEELRRRHEQIEEWRKSGLIGKKEYEELREQYGKGQARGSH